MLICDKCAGKVLEGSKFCPHCGDPITEADRQETEVAVTAEIEVEISFGRSSSANYDRAVSICKNIPTYMETGEGKKILHKVTLPITEVELVLNIYELVGSWKTSKMLIAGQPATKSALVYHGVGCYRERQKAYSREMYCFGEHEYDVNIWGCKKLNMPISSWGGGWLAFGSLDQRGVWHFDKDRIRHELEIAIRENGLCPVLNRKRILDTLDQLPDTINPKTDANWEYTTTYEEFKGDYREVATGIKPVIREATKYVLSDKKPDWDFPDNEDVVTHKIELQLADGNGKTRKTKPTSSGIGCWVPVAIMLLLFVIVAIATC